MRDIVYLVGPGERNEALRYSLRSLANLPHNRVWIVGHRPEWVAGVEYLPVSQRGPKHANTWANLEAVAAHGPESFYLFNDDYFLLHPMTEVPVFHRGSLDERIAYYARKPGLGAWARRGRNTRRALTRAGLKGDRLRSYELHLPLPLDREPLAEALAALHRVRETEARHYMKRTWVGNWLRLGGEQTRDCKVHSQWGNAALRGSFLSTSDRAWSGSAGAAIRARFAAPGPYERPPAAARRGSGHARLARQGRR